MTNADEVSQVDQSYVSATANSHSTINSTKPTAGFKQTSSNHQKSTERQKHAVATRPHTRVASLSRTSSHRPPQQQQQQQQQANNNRYQQELTSTQHTADTFAGTAPSGYRRSHSDAKQLPLHPDVADAITVSLTAAHSTNNMSQTNVKPVRSNGDMHHPQPHKRVKSSDKIARILSHNTIAKLQESNKPRLSNQHPISQHQQKAKSQVHFDLGNDGIEDDDDDDEQEDDDDEWVDASGSGSPYLSRKGSPGSEHSVRPDDSPLATTTTIQAVSDSGSHTQTTHVPHNESSVLSSPSHSASPPSTQPQASLASLPSTVAATTSSAHDQDTIKHNEYLTSRLLRRIPSTSAAPKLSKEIASMSNTPPRQDTGRLSGQTDLAEEYSILSQRNISTSQKDGLTSRFVATIGSGVSSQEASFNPSHNMQTRMNPRSSERRRSAGSLSHNRQSGFLNGNYANNNEDDRGVENPSQKFTVDSGVDQQANYSSNSEGKSCKKPTSTADQRAFAYKSTSRSSAAPSEHYRTQLKLELQRKSSVIDPVQTVENRDDNIRSLGAVNGSGFDKHHASSNRNNSRGGKIVERANMEYLVVRRYQNPVARSLARITEYHYGPLSDQSSRHDLTTTLTLEHSSNNNSRRPGEHGGGRYGGHVRKSSLQESSRPRRPVTPKRAVSVLPNSILAATEGVDASEAAAARADSNDDGTADTDNRVTLTDLLRALWDKPASLGSASQE